MHKIIASFLPLFFQLVSFGQEALLNGPMAVASVDPYTGAGSVSIPLYTLSADGMSVPIFLNYVGTGIKVNDQASWVGLGWNLSAGGTITREVRGLPDERLNGYIGGGNGLKVKAYFESQKPGGAPVTFDVGDFLAKSANGTIDTEADMFYFNLPGYKGKFFLDEQGKMNFIPKQNIKGDLFASNGSDIDMFTLITPDGIEYTFGLEQSTKEALSITTGDKTISYFSQWYLSRIKSPFTGRFIHFTYTSTEPISYSTFTETKLEYVSTYQRLCDGNGDPYNQWRTDYPLTNREGTAELLDRNPKTHETIYTLTSGAKKLRSISASTGIIRFVPKTSSVRLDIPDDIVLSQMEIYNHGYDLVKKYIFDTGYFTPNCDFEEHPPADCLRLKLLGLGLVTPSETRRLYTFDYNETYLLPKRNSFQQDHWGYFNDNSASTLIPFSAQYGGADRSANEAKMQANVLTKVNYPSGNFVQFEYETNRHSTPQGNTAYWGGLRVKKLSRWSVEHGYSHTTYTYDNMQANGYFDLPYEYTKKFSGYYNGLDRWFLKCYHWLFDDYYYVVRSSVPYNTYQYPNGRPVGYHYVTATQDNGEGISYRFSGLDSGIFDYKISNGSLGLYQEGVYFGVRTSGDARWGLPTEIISTNSRGEAVKRISNAYHTNIGTQIPSLRAYQPDDYNCFISPKGNFPYEEGVSYPAAYESSDLRIMRESCSPQQPSVVPYLYLNITPSNLKYTTTIYDYNKSTSGQMETRSSTTYHVYSEEGLLKQTCTMNPTSTLLKWLTYPTDYTNTTGFLATLKSKNMFPVIEEVSMIKYPDGNTVMKGGNVYVENKAGKQIVGGRINTYKEGTSLPDEQYELELETPQRTEEFTFSHLNRQTWLPLSPNQKGQFISDQRYKRRVRNESYDQDAHLIQMRREHDIPLSYIWGYGADYALAKPPSGVQYAMAIPTSLPIAEIQNAEVSEVAHTSFEGYNNFGKWSFDINSIITSTLFPARTGNKYFAGTITKTDIPACSSNVHCSNYTLSFWANGTGSVVVNDSKVVNSTNIFGWSYYELTLTPAEAQNISINTINGGKTVNIDELRLYPTKARMKTYTYQPLVGKTSETDERNRTTYYEYDEYNRIKLVRDNERNIVKKTTYHFKN